MIDEILIFKLNNEFYGLEVDNVIEIIKKQDVNRIPNARPHVKGITNVRGSINTVYNLGYILNLDVDEEEYFIVCKGEENNVVFPVTNITSIVKREEVIESEDSNINLRNFLSHNVKSVVSYKDDLIIVLNFEKLLTGEQSEMPVEVSEQLEN